MNCKKVFTLLVVLLTIWCQSGQGQEFQPQPMFADAPATSGVQLGHLPSDFFGPVPDPEPHAPEGSSVSQGNLAVLLGFAVLLAIGGMIMVACLRKKRVKPVPARPFQLAA